LRSESVIIADSKKIDIELRERLLAIGNEVEEEKNKLVLSPKISRLTRRLDSLAKELDLKTETIQIMESENQSVSARIRNLEDLCYQHNLEIRQLSQSKDAEVRAKTEENIRLQMKIRELESAMSDLRSQVRVTPVKDTSHRS
jgi:chromosome segregation ATPase